MFLKGFYAMEQNIIHNLILENKNKLSVSGVADVDTFDEGKIVLFTADDTLIIEGEDLHIQKLDVSNGELIIEGIVYSMQYTGDRANHHTNKGFFKKMLK